MPYQKIGTPVFWVDTLQYLRTMGIGGPGVVPDTSTSTLPKARHSDLFALNPTSYPAYKMPSLNQSSSTGYKRFEWYSSGAITFTSITDLHPNEYGADTPLFDLEIAPIDYLAILNHNLASTGYTTVRTDGMAWAAVAGETPLDPTLTNYLNSDISSDGFSIWDFSMSSYKGHRFSVWAVREDVTAETMIDQGEPLIGAISIGKRYQMPHSPDLNLTQTYDYGVKEVETKGGASLSNNMWKNPKWGQLGAWELGVVNNNEPDQNAVNLSPLARSGRKVYDLSFSYLDDGDVFGANQTLSLGDDAWQGIVTPGDYPDIDDNDVQDVDPGSFQFNKNILNDESFFTSVIHKTNGGQLPFIFQPDSEDKTNMVIAKLDMKSFSFKQVANGVYNIKLKIREVW